MLTCSVVSALAAAGWWWFKWPERTASRFMAGQVGGTVESVKATRPSLSDWASRQATIEVETQYGSGIYTHLYEVAKNRIRCIETRIQMNRHRNPERALLLAYGAK
jgi:hypothetical protein